MSTSVTRVGSSKPKVLLALLTSFLVALSGLFVVPAATAAEGATVHAEITSATTEGLGVNINFEGVTEFPAGKTGVYVAVVESGTVNTVGAGAFLPSVAIRGGAGAGSYTVPSDELDRSVAYEALVWYAHGNPTDDVILARAPLEISTGQWDAVFPPAVAEPTTVVVTSNLAEVEEGEQVTLSVSVTPAEAAGSVQFFIDGAQFGEAQMVAEGTAGITTGELAAGTHNFIAKFTPADEALFAVSESDSVSVVVKALEEEEEEENGEEFPSTPPSIRVYATDGVTELDSSTPVYNGDEIVIKGTGFDPEANVGGRGMPIPAHLPQGSYVVFGNFAQNWKPSASAPNANRVAGPQAWVLSEEVLDQVPANFKNTILAQWAELFDDGTFEAKLTIEALPATDRSNNPIVLPEDGTYGVYSYGAGGVTNADQELRVELNYQGDRPTNEWVPAIEVFMSDGATPYTHQEVREGDTLVVRGTGFDPQANVGGRGVPIPADLAQGTFVVFGSFADVWKPSEDAPLSDRTMDNESRWWALSDETMSGIPSEYVGDISEKRVKLEEDGSFTATIELVAPETPHADLNWGIYTYPGGVGTPANPAQELSRTINFVTETDENETPTGATGGLIWSFKSSWNFYFDNNAAGVREVSHGATLGDNNQIGFVQVPGGDYDPEIGLGTIKYQGTVNYVSKQHGFDAVLSNPWVVFTSDGATLSAEVSRDAATDFDELVRLTVADLNAQTPVEDDEHRLRWDAVTGVFSEGLTHPDSWADYVGETIDPVTFTFGAEEEAPVSPPAVTINKQKVKQGEDIIFTGSGFDVGAKVTAVIHSQPVSLPMQVAHGSGQVSWTWTVPTDFETGQHTITLTSGDVVVKNTFEVQPATTAPGGAPAVTPAPEDTCVARAVVGGSLNWGFKESFRTYVQGTIANGTFSGGSFSATGGAVNPEQGGIGMANFGGSINATGHGGVLDYSISNPSVQITSATSGILYATAGGKRVAYASLSFGGVSVSGDTVSVGGAAATLTAAGSATLGEYAEMYPAGEALDPVSFSVTLGGEVPCDDSTDPVLLAATGTAEQGTAAMMSIAVVLMLIGAGLVSARRRGAFAQR